MALDFYNDDDEGEEGEDAEYEQDEEVQDDRHHEPLPEPKSLVRQAEEEEEDMGYDEDDERIAISVKRPEELPPVVEKDFVNEEGSGGSATNRYKNNDNSNNNRFRSHYLENFHRKQQKTLPAEEPRESSGNFANDDEEDDDDDDDGFFSAQRKSGNRYFRKNTNDAIKIISTPLGKVGIVYQQSPTPQEEQTHETKKPTLFTDFDALSPDPESSHRLASSHPKITPVLTPDGKVALLYRGDAENSNSEKYAPIRNMTHKFNSKSNATTSDSSTDNKANAEAGTRLEDNTYADSAEDEDEDEDEDDIDFHNNAETGPAKINPEEEPAGIDGVTPTTGSFIIRSTDSVLPMINRPLSEVLGIKKNQFKQFRIKDMPTTSASTTESTARSLVGGGTGHNNGQHTDSSATLHLLTKVNLAEYPNSARTRNRDFDFSRDNTMLDERTRRREEEARQQQQQLQQASGSSINTPLNELSLNTIANEEVLAKTEVVNLAIIPHFEEELERLQRLREHEARRHHRQRHNRHKQSPEDLSGIHCIMQAMMGIAAISTVFGMLGTFFKQRILDQLRLMHW